MKYCTHCGKEIKPGTKFCTNCGTVLSDKTDKKEQKIKPKKKNKTLLPIAAGVIILLCACVFLIGRSGKKENGLTDNNKIQEDRVEETKEYSVKTETKSDVDSTEKKGALNQLLDKSSPIEDFTIMEDRGKYYIEKYNGFDKNIIIPQEYEGTQIYGIYRLAFQDMECIESVVIPSTIREIGSCAFKNCFNLKDITIEPGDNRLEIGAMAFDNCISLEKLTLPSRVSHFSGCNNCIRLKQFRWEESEDKERDSKELASTVEFVNCDSLSSCIIEDSFRTSGSVQFIDCDSIKALSIPEGNTDIRGAEDNKNLETIVIPSTAVEVDGGTNNLALVNVVIKEGQEPAQLKGFENCNHLASLDVPKNYEVLDMSHFPGSIEELIWRDSGEGHPNKKIIWSYSVRESLKIIYLPRIRTWDNNSSGSEFRKAIIYTLEGSLAIEEAEKNGWSYEIISKMPDRSKEIKELEKKSEKLKAGEYIMDSITIDDAEIERGIAKITSESGADTSVVGNATENAGETLNSTPAEDFVFSTVGYQNFKVISEYIGDKEDIIITPDISDEEFYVAPDAFAGNERIKSVTIKGVRIDSRAFKGCSNLEEVTIYGAKDYDEWKFSQGKHVLNEEVFSDCKNLKKVHIIGAYLTWGSGSFKDDTSLTEVDIDDNMTTIGQEAFMGCTALKNIRIPSECQTILSSAFKDCTALENVEWNSTVDTYILSTERYHSISASAFENCSSLRGFDIPEKTSLDCKSFKGCSSLEEIIISQDTWENSRGIPSECFMDCTSLKKVDILSGTSNVLDCLVDQKAFFGCTSLEKIEIPESFKALQHYAFENCSSLRRVEWHDNDDTKPSQFIGGSVFIGCTSLEDVYIPRLESVGKGITIGVFDEDTKVTVHTPDGSVMSEYSKEHNLKCVNK
ncbi:leucine-rich repeat protein [Butyrivibrio proteoclasticus]|uniref:leucine-rich repeat protein n=1 Tax=Butyrivibrio proteoclasticus TaxID=43305 RepID=UPI00047C33D0|nr:leucine-rich repeat protein [Butyrivibrio proteoclasticus]